MLRVVAVSAGKGSPRREPRGKLHTSLRSQSRGDRGFPADSRTAEAMRVRRAKFLLSSTEV